MQEPLLYLGGTLEVGTAHRYLALGAERGRAALRPLLRQANLPRSGGPLLAHDLDDLGNHVAGAFHEYRVAHPHIEALDLVLVVERGVLHDDAADRDRLEHRHRREHPGAPDVAPDVANHGRFLARRKLVGDRPAWRTGQLTEALAQLEGVHLDHRPVDLVVELIAIALELAVKLDHALAARAPLEAGVHLEAELPQALHQVHVAADPEVRLAAPGSVHEDVEPPRGADLGIQLAQGSGGGVARIREGLETVFQAVAVHPRELVQGHEDLASDLQDVGGIARAQAQRDRAHGAQVVGDVLPDMAIPSGRAPPEDAVLIEQLDGDAVVFQLDRVGDGLIGLEQAANPRVERLDLLRADGVVE